MLSNNNDHFSYNQLLSEVNVIQLSAFKLPKPLTMINNEANGTTKTNQPNTNKSFF